MRPIYLLILFALITMNSCSDPGSIKTVNSTLIVLTFDDGDKSIYELAFPLMKEYGYHGVNFIPTGWIGQYGRMTLEQVKELEYAGWETGGHSITHANLTTITPDSARDEIKRNYEQLVKYGLKHNCFALPAGHSNAAIDSIIKEYFKIIRTSQNEKYRLPLNLDRLGYYQVQKNDDANSLMMRAMHGINSGECLVIFGFHNFTNEESDFITTIKLSVFIEFLKGIKKRNLKVMTLSDAVGRITAEQ